MGDRKSCTASFYIQEDNKEYIMERVEEQHRKGNHRYNPSNFIDDLLTHLRTKPKSNKGSRQ